MFIHSEACQDETAQTRQILAQTHERKREFILLTHPRAWANTRLAQRFTLVWKDKHQPINTSVSLETCWPPPFSFCHTHTHTAAEVKVRQGWAEGQCKVSVLVCTCVCVCVGMQADKTVHRVKDLLCGCRLAAAAMFLQSGRELWPDQALRNEAVSSGGMLATNWHNLLTPTCHSLFSNRPG